MAGSSPSAATANWCARAGSTRALPPCSSTSPSTRRRAPAPIRAYLALIQLEFDAPVAAQDVFAIAFRQRPELGESRRHQAIGRNALIDQEFDHGDGARGRELPVRTQAAMIGLLVSMAVDPQQPVDIVGNAGADVL